jgi:hypothetical protein
MKKIVCVLALLVSHLAFAEHHASVAPVETWNCSLNEGKSMNDIINVSKAVGVWSKSKGLNDAQWIFIPSSGDLSDQGRFVLMTGWGDWSEMGKAQQGFFGDGEGTQIFADFNAAATCESRNFWTVQSTYNHISD